MKIIDLGVCLDNIDPKGVGRIRVEKLSDSSDAKKNSFEFEEWGESDPFVAQPFLPTNINFIPEIGQTVKVLSYNTDSPDTNQEYIAGPFSTQYDYNAQTHSTQVLNNTFGTGFKKKKDIVNKTGELINPKSKNAFAKPKDFAIYGKYGSDVIFTENGLVLRGGKLRSKEAANLKNKKALIDEPIMSKRSPKMQLRKFPSRMRIVTVESSEKIKQDATLKYLLEYSIDDLDAPRFLDVYIYQIDEEAGGYYNTKNFRQDSYKKTKGVKLINNALDNTSPTHTIDLHELEDYAEQVANETILNSLASELRICIERFFSEGFKAFTGIINTIDTPRFPFAYRPTKELTERQTNNTKRKAVFKQIGAYGTGPEFSVLWEGIVPPEKVVKKKEEVVKVDKDSPEQTFASLTADRLYLLSTDTNAAGGNGVDFAKLDDYEYTQEDYIERIDPNSYSIVRGENLIKFLRAVFEVIITHQHNVIGPLVQTGNKPLEDLKQLIDSMENDLLNKSVRIN
jgi:hypothetical protein